MYDDATYTLCMTLDFAKDLDNFRYDEAFGRAMGRWSLSSLALFSYRRYPYNLFSKSSVALRGWPVYETTEPVHVCRMYSSPFRP